MWILDRLFRRERRLACLRKKYGHQPPPASETRSDNGDDSAPFFIGAALAGVSGAAGAAAAVVAAGVVASEGDRECADAQKRRSAERAVSR